MEQIENIPAKWFSKGILTRVECGWFWYRRAGTQNPEDLMVGWWDGRAFFESTDSVGEEMNYADIPEELEFQICQPPTENLNIG